MKENRITVLKTANQELNATMITFLFRDPYPDYLLFHHPSFFHLTVKTHKERKNKTQQSHITASTHDSDSIARREKVNLAF